MNLRSISRALTIALGVFALGASAVPADSFAKKNKNKSEEPLEIKETKVSSFDDVFSQVGEIKTDLDKVQSDLAEASDKIAEAMGMSKGTPVADALADLKEKGKDHIKLTVAGDKPSLTVDDAAPENVKAAVNATNGAVVLWVDSAKTLAGLVEKSKAVAAAAQELPPQVPDAAKELAPGDALKFPKLVKHNVDATMQTKDQVGAVAEALKTNLETVKAFGQ